MSSEQMRLVLCWAINGIAIASEECLPNDMRKPASNVDTKKLATLCFRDVLATMRKVLVISTETRQHKTKRMRRGRLTNGMK